MRNPAQHTGWLLGLALGVCTSRPKNVLNSSPPLDEGQSRWLFDSGRQRLAERLGGGLAVVPPSGHNHDASLGLLYPLPRPSDAALPRTQACSVGSGAPLGQLSGSTVLWVSGVWVQASSSSQLQLRLLPKLSYCRDCGLNKPESRDQSPSIRVPRQAVRSRLKSLPLSPLPSAPQIMSQSSRELLQAISK